MIGDWLFVVLGGCCGALLRYALAREIAERWPRAFPLGTFLINVTGAFVLGALYAATKGELFALFGVGLMGAYTTFSTFGVETVTLLQKRQYGTALLYVTSSVLLGFASAWLGFDVVY